MSELQLIIDRLNDMNSLLVQTLDGLRISGSQIQVVDGLSDISERLGLVMAGEFRSGNSVEPGDGFSGVRIGYPAFVYGSDSYHIVGVDNDVLQFGLDADTGIAVAGAGNVVLDSKGINLKALGATGSSHVRWWDDAVDQNTMYSRIWSDIGIMNVDVFQGTSNARGVFYLHTEGKGTTIPGEAELAIKTSISNASETEVEGGVAYMRFSDGLNGGALLNLGYDIYLAAPGNNSYHALTETVFNEMGRDINFRVESDDVTHMFYINAGIDRIGIGSINANGTLQITQHDSTGEVPALYLEQLDVDEPMMTFDATIATGNAIEIKGSKSLSTTHFLKVNIAGVGDRYIQIGTIA